MNLVDEVFGPDPISTRRLSVLIGGLGPDSQYRRAVGDTWSHDREIAAETLEMVHALYRVTVGNLRVREGSRAPEPLRVNRPGDESAPKQKRSLLSQMRSAFGNARR